MVSLLPKSLTANSLVVYLVSGMIFTGFFFAAEAAVGSELYNAVAKTNNA